MTNTRQKSRNAKRDARQSRQASGESKQPRFSSREATEFYFSIMNWTHNDLENEPNYVASSTIRDEWLAEVWMKEPHLAGVLNSVVSIDKNRGWTLIGGRNQVNKYQDILHDFEAAPNLGGWRMGTSVAALSYYTSDVGTIIEVGRDGIFGPLRKMFCVDPTRCSLTGDIDFPLKYNPYNGKPQDWMETDFMRITSLPDVREQFMGLGHCAVSRCVELTKLMVAVFEHDREALGSRAPKGLLLLDGIDEDQWDDAMKVREAKQDGLEQEYFKGIGVLASGGAETIDAKLVALSQLPTGFDLQTFVSLLMYGYALAFGYDPSEFYPVQFGALGRGTEMEVQHEKATTKGKLDYAYGFQEQLQLELPPTLEFTFDERDDAGELMQTEVKKAQADLVSTMRNTGPGDLTTEEARQLWAEEGLIPREWTEATEEAEAEDTGETEQEEPNPEETGSEETPEETPESETRTRDRLLSNVRIRAAAETFPKEAIVEYRWPDHKTRTLYSSGKELLLPPVFQINVTWEDTEKKILEGLDWQKRARRWLAEQFN